MDNFIESNASRMIAEARYLADVQTGRPITQEQSGCLLDLAAALTIAAATVRTDARALDPPSVPWGELSAIAFLLAFLGGCAWIALRWM